MHMLTLLKDLPHCFPREGPGEELQRDSPAGHDLEPCGGSCPSA